MCVIIKNMAQKHSRLTSKGRCVWQTERLWRLAENLPVKSVLVESVSEFDTNCWFDDAKAPTCRAIAAHAKRIYEADLSYPIILSAEGFLMDGGHRLAKAWLLEIKEVRAVQFETNPEPDEVRHE
jgi:hypothetical protein